MLQTPQRTKRHATSLQHRRAKLKQQERLGIQLALELGFYPEIKPHFSIPVVLPKTEDDTDLPYWAR